MQEPKFSKTNYWMVTAKLKNLNDKIFLLRSLRSKGFGFRSVWRPIHCLKIYNKCPRDNMSNSNLIFNITINLPSSSTIYYE